MGNMSLAYWQDQLGKVDPHVTHLEYKITGAKVASPIVSNSIALIAYDAIASQAVINDHLGTTNEFLVANFDAVALGADAVAFIVDMGGQVKALSKVVVSVYSGTGGSTKVERCVQASALTATLATEAAVGASGNVAVKAAIAGVDALTSGTIVVELYWISK